MTDETTSVGSNEEATKNHNRGRVQRPPRAVNTALAIVAIVSVLVGVVSISALIMNEMSAEKSIVDVEVVGLSSNLHIHVMNAGTEPVLVEYVTVRVPEHDYERKILVGQRLSSHSFEQFGLSTDFSTTTYVSHENVEETKLNSAGWWFNFFTLDHLIPQDFFEYAKSFDAECSLSFRSTNSIEKHVVEFPCLAAMAYTNKRMDLRYLFKNQQD